MSLADYFKQGALAGVQILQGYDESRFLAKLEESPVGVTFDETALTPEGKKSLDLLVRLLARLYPRLALLGPSQTSGDLRALAKLINPNIEFVQDASVVVNLGERKSDFETVFYAGSSGWNSRISNTIPQHSGDSDNPFGAGVASCLAAANVFRRVFLPGWSSEVDADLAFSAWQMDRVHGAVPEPESSWHLSETSVLFGLGAIGNATLWSLVNSPVEGTLHLVDPETIEMSNLQRYVLARHQDVGDSKVQLGASFASRNLNLIPHDMTLGVFLDQLGYHWDHVLLGLDSKRDRRSAQAALPKWVANAWTQPGDLGISIHPDFGMEGACVSCLYVPSGRVLNEDELISRTLGVPQLLGDVRVLLHLNSPLQRNFLESVGRAVNKPIEALLPFEGRPIRALYTEGFCGGAVIPMGGAGRPPIDLHVPLAHQSALAGVLLGASLTRSNLGGDPQIASATRIDVLQRVRSGHTQPLRANRDGRCICDDSDYRNRYNVKYL